MAAIVIRISVNGSGPGIILSDGQNSGGAITTVVRNRDTVQWKVMPTSTIISLDGIKDSATSIFNPAPRSQGDGSWQGTVASLPGSTKPYSVTCTLNGAKLSLYPKIQVNP